MKLSEYFSALSGIVVSEKETPVCHTVAEELRSRYALNAVARTRMGKNSLCITTGRIPDPLHVPAGSLPETWAYAGVDADNRGYLACSHPMLLYSFYSFLTEIHANSSVSRFRSRLFKPAFRWQRPVWDLYFAQSGRFVRNMDPESYVRSMARHGFTHLEVNSLASEEGIEEGVPGEVYPRFYTYCPALDQFVSSSLNRGTYPESYLRANLERLKTGARFAAKYGLVPVMTCFEPRSVPEKLLDRYPELRGARVDHPFRSFKPRYNLAVQHPTVQEHYRELVTNLLKEVPELSVMSVWTNDSGAGFEHTRSLYVGANGSAYLVREWSDPEKYAAAAGENAVQFLRLLQEAGSAVNPQFRVVIRLEPFVEERGTVMDGLGSGLDLETPSLNGRGWEYSFKHPVFVEDEANPFTIFNNSFGKDEKRKIQELDKRDCRTHVMYSHGPVNNFEPLLGIPAPWLTYEKLRALKSGGARYLAHIGGIAPPDSVPWNLNEEIFRCFQFDPGMDIEKQVVNTANRWAGPENSDLLVEVWKTVDRAIRSFSPNPLYFSWGVWYRLEIRPLVPDIGAIPEKKRIYYEKHMLSTHHNPNRVDLNRDVLFTLLSPDDASVAVERIDTGTLPLLDKALSLLQKTSNNAIMIDLRDRIAALRCWCRTRRNVAAWISWVHGYLNCSGSAMKKTYRTKLGRMIKEEIENTKELLELWNSARTEFMAVSSLRETTFIYDSKFGNHLRSKIALMEEYGDRSPAIDETIMWRVAELQR